MSRIRLFNTKTFELQSFSPIELEKRKFAAISYVWEYNQNPAFPANLIIKSATWQIASMAQTELRDIISFAYTSGYPEIWMDVLCIEQDNNNDKVAMLPLMSYIYGYAAATLVKLDQNFPDSGILGVEDADPVNSTDIGLTNNELGYNTMDGVRGSIRLARWFTRVWTLQEAVLSKKLVIITKKAGKLVERTSLSVFHQCIKDIGSANVGGQRATDAYLQCSVLNTSQPLPLCLALQAVAVRDCTVPEDRYYGVFGLLKNVTVSPRYTGNVDTARDIFIRNLNASEALQLACVDHRGNTQSSITLPSWFPRENLQMRGAPVLTTPSEVTLREIPNHGRAIILKPGNDCRVEEVRELSDDGPAVGVAHIKAAAKFAVENGILNVTVWDPRTWMNLRYLPGTLSMLSHSVSRNHNYEIKLRDGTVFRVVAFTKPQVGWCAAYGGKFSMPWPAGDAHAIIMFTVDEATSIGVKQACYSTTTHPGLVSGSEEVAIV